MSPAKPEIAHWGGGALPDEFGTSDNPKTREGKFVSVDQVPDTGLNPEEELLAKEEEIGKPTANKINEAGFSVDDFFDTEDDYEPAEESESSKYERFERLSSELDHLIIQLKETEKDILEVEKKIKSLNSKLTKMGSADKKYYTNELRNLESFLKSLNTYKTKVQIEIDSINAENSSFKKSSLDLPKRSMEEEEGLKLQDKLEIASLPTIKEEHAFFHKKLLSKPKRPDRYKKPGRKGKETIREEAA
jgi:hypothetical protein